MSDLKGATPVLTKKDFISDQEVRWCPGCGDYAILAQVQKVVPKLGIPKENFVFVSGIGCSSRFPYYMNTYGFHTIHGRAPTIATGIKVANPELSVWLVTGDGDALSIGGNHLIHALRRNVDIKILLFNNRIYGLTKGQYSPTSEQGKRTKSTPMGSVDYPLHPVSTALAAEATFVARTIDTETKHLTATLERAAAHKGSAFVEIFQNCNIFNDKAFDYFKGKDVKSERIVEIEHGRPLRFGPENEKGITWNGKSLEVVTVGEGAAESDLIVHDEQASLHSPFLLGRMDYPAYPIAIGVFRAIERATYENLVDQQVATAKESREPETLRSLLYSADSWEVK